MEIPNEINQYKKILQLLKDTRHKSGIRQIELAEKLGVPQSFISKYESGNRRLDILELRQICQVLGVSLVDFIHQMEESLDETE